MEDHHPTPSFSNLVVELDALPDLSNPDFSGLPKRFKKFRLISLSIVAVMLSAMWVIPVLVRITKEGEDRFILMVVALVFGSVWSLLVGLLLLEEFKGFPLRGYALREKDLSYRNGWLFRKQTTVPFNRIQHSEITQGPLGRAFKLAKLKIYTAGGASSDLSIPGMDPEEAASIRDYVNGKAQDHA